MQKKTITDSQMIGRRGEEIVADRALEMGFIYTHNGPLEAGVDGFLEIRDPNSGRVTGQIVAVQVKTTAEGAFPGETEAGFHYRMREADVAYWRDANVPVVIVLVHLGKKTVYWKNVEARQGDGHRELRFDKARDTFDKSACDAIANLCVDRGQFGVYLPPLNHGEVAHVNLLRVRYPSRIYTGFSPYTIGRDALSTLLKHEDRPPDDWVIRARQFMSFRDPTTWPLSEVVDVGTVESIDSEEAAFPDDEAEEHTFIDLLRRTMATQLEGLLSFDKLHRACYFAAQPPKIGRSYKYRSLKKPTSAQVVQVYRKDRGAIKYVRHHAFQPKFWRVDEEWLMSVAPTYHFTWDGVRPDKFASDRLAGKKQRELNSALGGQLAMWKHLLVDDIADHTTDLFSQSGGRRRYPPMSFEALEPLELQKAVPEKTWRQADKGFMDDDLFAAEEPR